MVTACEISFPILAHEEGAFTLSNELKQRPRVIGLGSTSDRGEYRFRIAAYAGYTCDPWLSFFSFKTVDPAVRLYRNNYNYRVIAEIKKVPVTKQRKGFRKQRNYRLQSRSFF